MGRLQDIDQLLLDLSLLENHGIVDFINCFRNVHLRPWSGIFLALWLFRSFNLFIVTILIQQDLERTGFRWVFVS
jgi:hypothetical protein